MAQTKEQRKEYQREYYSKNKAYISKQYAVYRAENKEKIALAD